MRMDFMGSRFAPGGFNRQLNRPQQPLRQFHMSGQNQRVSNNQQSFNSMFGGGGLDFASLFSSFLSAFGLGGGITNINNIYGNNNTVSQNNYLNNTNTLYNQSPVYNEPPAATYPAPVANPYGEQPPSYQPPAVTYNNNYMNTYVDQDLYGTQTPVAPTYNYEVPTYDGGDQGKYWGDPHLIGFDGEKYDVMGDLDFDAYQADLDAGKVDLAGIPDNPAYVKTYNMISDQNVQYNTTFVPWGSKGASVIGAAGIQVGQDQVYFDRSGAAPTVNGVALQNGQNVDLANGGSANWDGSRLLVNTGEYLIDLKMNTNDRGNHLESNVSLTGKSPFADFVMPHGLLGQTADGIAGAKRGNLGLDQGKQGGKVIDGTVADYQVSDLWASDFAFNRFGAQIDWSNSMIGSNGLLQQVKDVNGNIIFTRPNANPGTSASAS